MFKYIRGIMFWYQRPWVPTLRPDGSTGFPALADQLTSPASESPDSGKYRAFSRKAALVGATLMAWISGLANAQTPLWQDVASSQIPTVSKRLIEPSKARLVSVDMSSLQSKLDQAQDESAVPADGMVVSLPMPDGTSQDFRIVRTNVMHPELAARYPEIHTYSGVSTQDSRVATRFDTGPRGFHGAVYSPAGTVYIDPYQRGDEQYYQSYFTRDMPARQRPQDEILGGAESGSSLVSAQSKSLILAAKGASIGNQLLTYRLALATTGEYAAFQDPAGAKTSAGPSKAIVLAELVNVVNRVTGVYERELGIRLQLIANEDQVIFTNSALDPFLNTSGSAMLGVVTSVINTVIGATAYDIGHVVSTGGGGLSNIGVVCGGAKGGGVTGLAEPVGDAFYIDYVAHEMGHQFGANHTFNSQLKQCGGGNRAAATAVEPGSGSTIMSYAGICGDDDLSEHADAYFSSASFDEIVAYTRQGNGASCAAVTSTGNHAPVASVRSGGFTIPKQTPFELDGSATDVDGDAISYQWEERDIGAAGSPDSPDASAPLFRSFAATASSTRVFPQLSDLLNNDHTMGELLPTVARSLSFRFTARDNHAAPQAGGVGSADLQFNVTDRAGPFRITSPNGGSSYASGSSLPVTWDVAGTDAAPVSCSLVDISLSTDGGQSFPTVLASATANDGSETVNLPQISTSKARVKIKCSDNVFFDISDSNFGIAQAASAPAKSASGGGGSFGGSGLVVLALAAWGRRRSRRTV